MNNFTSFHPEARYSLGAAPPLPIAMMPTSQAAAALSVFQQHMLGVLAALESELLEHVTELTEFVHAQTTINQDHAHSLGGN